jgi:hypothetical protein
VEDLGLEELVKRGRMERAIRWEEWAEWGWVWVGEEEGSRWGRMPRWCWRD